MDNENQTIYIIPYNYEDTGGVFGGLFKFRNVLEAIIIGLLLFKGGGMAFAFLGITLKIIMFMVIIIPIVLIALIGIQGESLTEYIQSVYNFRKRRRVAGYRPPSAAGEELEKKKTLINRKTISKF